MEINEKTIDESKNDEKRTPAKSPWELFGVDVGYGWYGLVLPIINAIKQYNAENPDDELIISQVKEKWGQLVFSAWTSDDTKHIKKMIKKAEHESKYICEVCGARGQLREVDGWFRTLCKECRKAIEYKEIIFKFVPLKKENTYMAKNKINGKWYTLIMEREKERVNFFIKICKERKLLDIHIICIKKEDGNSGVNNEKWYIVENNKKTSEGKSGREKEELEKSSALRIFCYIRDGHYNVEAKMFCLKYKIDIYKKEEDNMQGLKKLDEYTVKKEGSRRFGRGKYEYTGENGERGYLIREEEICEGELYFLRRWYFKDNFDKESAEKFLKDYIT